MTSTYETIRVLPGKTYNWTALNAALRTMYLAEGLDFVESQEARYAEKGIRAARTAAMEMACSIVHHRATRSSFQAPSEETLSWGGFLGGSTNVWTDEDAQAEATAEICKLVTEIV